MVDQQTHVARDIGSAEVALNLFGACDENLSFMEQQLSQHGLETIIDRRGNKLRFFGSEDAVNAALRVYDQLLESADKPLNAELILPVIKEVVYGKMLTVDITDQASEKLNATSPTHDENNTEEAGWIQAGRLKIKARGENQRRYLAAIRKTDINFGIGPAGTGKTYLAVACAVEALLSENVERILLVRPAVEAGEKLGFLPGDLAQKIDPYLRPLYDALHEMLGSESVSRLMEKGVIEVAPLAFMRGRTLSRAFILLDESQNTTTEQMKMFLTRIGFGSTAVITGDLTQVDLAGKQESGLQHITKVLKNVKGIHFSYFAAEDVVRHPLVQRIVEAYETWERNKRHD